MKIDGDFALNETLWYSVMNYYIRRDKNLANAGKSDKKKSESHWMRVDDPHSNIMFFEELYNQRNPETITEKSNKK
jgi:hypothetical protein